MEEMNLSNLPDGAYALEYPDGSYMENVKYGLADFNKLYVRRVRLPAGKGNIIYLLANTFNESLLMIKNQSFLIPPGYRRIFYPKFITGSFMGRRYRLNLSKDKPARDKFIKETTKLNVYPARTLGNIADNIFFGTADIYAAVKPIMQKFSIKRNYESFFKEFISILKNSSPSNTIEGKDGEWNNRILIMDTDSLKFNPAGKLLENKANPLYLLYLAYFRTRDLSTTGINMDMLICSKNMFLKFNPATLTSDKWSIFRRALFRIMNANLDDYTDHLSDEEKSEIGELQQDKTIAHVVNKTIEPYVQNVSGSTKTILQDAVETKVKTNLRENIKQKIETKALVSEINKKIDDKSPNSYSSISSKNNGKQLTKRELDIMRSITGDISPLASEIDEYIEDEIGDYEEEIKDETTEVLTSDEDVAEEVLDEIQNNNVPLNNERTSPINSARDKKLREEQKKVVIKGKTIEEIVESDSTNVPIESTDKSSVMHTTNKNMTQITFANFDKTYIDQLYMKDIVSCFDFLKDKEYPFYVTGVEVKDSSNSLDYKDTWSVHLKDETGKRSTIKVDIPKFQNDRFMLIQGNRYIILKQNFYNPLVKDTPDTVIITTNYNKVTVGRKTTRSLSNIERIFSLIKKHKNSDMFISGDSSKSNMKYISTLEYDEISKRIFKYLSGNTEIFFSREYIKEHIDDPKDLKGDEFVIGHEGQKLLIINEDTGLDREGRTICEIIEQSLPKDYKEEYDKIKAPSQLMYVEATMAGQDIPVIVILMIWNGFKKAMDSLNIYWRFIPNAKKSNMISSRKYIRFADGLLEYEPKIFAELILNGLSKLHPETFTFDEFETEAGYDNFIYAQFGTYNGITEIQMFNEFLVDPITKSVCHDMSLPDTASGLLVNAVKMLSDNGCVSKASDKSYRVRSIEMIPSILYGCLAAQYKTYVKSGRRIPMTLNQRCVISKLIQEKTVEAYSTLNPVVEVKRTHTISTKGYKGSNSEYSYDEQKRSYDPSSVGKIAITTSPKMRWAIKTPLIAGNSLELKLQRLVAIYSAAVHVTMYGM